MKQSLNIPGTSNRLDLDAFTRGVMRSAASPAKELVLALLRSDADEGNHRQLEALLASPLNRKIGDPEDKVTLTLPALFVSAQPCDLPCHTTSGFRPPEYYTTPRISRRQLATGAAALGAGLAVLPPLLNNETPDTHAAQPGPLHAQSGGPTLPWSSMLIGGSVVTLGYVLSLTMDKQQTLGEETSRRSRLGLDYAQKPLDSAHAASNLLAILNSFLPPHQAASRSR